MLAYLFLFLAQIMVGISVVGSKYLIASMPALVLLAIRFSLATLVLLPLHYVSNGRTAPIQSYLKPLSKKDWFFILAQALSAGAFFNLLLLLGLHYTDANVAGVIMSALPAIIAVLSFLILKEKLSLKKCSSILLATFGLLLISTNELGNHHINHSFLGNLIIVLSLLPEAGYYILSKLHSNQLPIFLMAALMNGINALLLLPIVLLFAQWQIHLSMFQWVILGLVSIASGLFYVFWGSGSHKTEGMIASLSTALMPIATVTIAWLTLGEAMSILQLGGMGLVMTSIVTYTFS